MVAVPLAGRSLCYAIAQDLPNLDQYFAAYTTIEQKRVAVLIHSLAA